MRCCSSGTHQRAKSVSESADEAVDGRLTSPVAVDASGPPSSASSSIAFSLQAAAEKPLPTLLEMTRHLSTSYSADAVRSRCTISSVQVVVFALSLVQYLTCSVPELRPGKKSAICFHVRFFVSLSSTNKASSSAVNLSFGPFGLAAGDGIPGWPTTDVCSSPASLNRCDLDGGGWFGRRWW